MRGAPGGGQLADEGARDGGASGHEPLAEGARARDADALLGEGARVGDALGVCARGAPGGVCPSLLSLFNNNNKNNAIYSPGRACLGFWG